MQHAKYNAAYLASVAQAATAYYKLIADACEALLEDEHYAEYYYTGNAAFFDVLDFVTPTTENSTRGEAPEIEVVADVYNSMFASIHAKMFSITGLAMVGNESYVGDEHIAAALAPHIGWSAE